MRLTACVSLPLLSIAGLTACRNEASYRAEVRTEAVRNCQNGDPVARAQLTRRGVDIVRLCNCVIDGYLRSASYEQLKRDENNPNPPGMQAQFPRCAAEQGMIPRAQSAPAAAADAVANAQDELDRAASEIQSQAESAIAEIENSVAR